MGSFGLSFSPENLHQEAPWENWLFGFLVLPLISPARAADEKASVPKASMASVIRFFMD